MQGFPYAGRDKALVFLEVVYLKLSDARLDGGLSDARGDAWNDARIKGLRYYEAVFQGPVAIENARLGVIRISA